MKKKLLILAALIALAIICAACANSANPEDTSITIGGQTCLPDQQELAVTVTSEEELDLLTQLTQLRTLDLKESRLTLPQYEKLQSALPQCKILWQVPFQGSYLPQNTRKLTFSDLTNEDLQALAYLPELSEADASGCRAYEQLDELMAAYPHISISYDVTIAGQIFPHTTTEMTLDGPAVEDMASNLRYLPNLASVTLNGVQEDLEGIANLVELYPDVLFSYQLEVCGITVDRFVEEIDLSGIQMTDTQELESKLNHLPNLKKVDMCGCGISNEEMEALNNRHDQTLFVWEVQIGSRMFRTDVSFFMPVKYHMSVDEDDTYNMRYLTEVIAVDLGHMDVRSCEFIRYMPHLKYLILADTGIKDISPLEGLQELVFLELFINTIPDLTPLVTLTALEDLNLCYVSGDYQVLAQMPWLKRLWWTTRSVDEEGWAYLQEALPNTQINHTTLSSTGEGWREGQLYFDMRDAFGASYMTH